jgi:hypothetical protein
VEPVSAPLLDRRATAIHFAVSVRTVDGWLAAGCPHCRLAGRPKLRPAEVEGWLVATGRLEFRGVRLAAAYDGM